MYFLSNPKNFSYRLNMASPCMQLCFQCRRFLLSKPVTRGWHYRTAFSNSTCPKVLHASLVVRWTHKTNWTQHRWMQHNLFFNGFATRHVSTDTKGTKVVEELSITDVVSYKSPLLPVRDVPVSQMPLGKYWCLPYGKSLDFNCYL